MSLSEQATTYLVAAARAPNPGPGADPEVVLGRRLWNEIFGLRRSSRQPARAVRDLVGHLEDPEAQAELEGRVHSALTGDAELEAAVGQMLAAFYREQARAGSIQAMVDLGDLLRWQEDRDGARAAYQQAIEAGDAHALFDLAHLLRSDLGDAAGARAALEQAIDCGGPDLAAEALVDLGYLLMMLPRDYAAAQDCFEQAIGSGHTKWAPAAMVGLARLLEKRGNATGARAAYQRAADAGNADCAAHALVFLGVMLRKDGDHDGARAAFQRVVDLGNADWSPAARAELLNLLPDRLTA